MPEASPGTLRAANATRWTVRVLGTLQIGLGLAFWSGNLFELLPLHILNGLVLVLLLWAIAGLAARAGAPRGQVAFAGVWGLVVLWLGMSQVSLLPGEFHWIVQVAHLLVGIALIGMSDRLAGLWAASRSTGGAAGAGRAGA